MAAQDRWARDRVAARDDLGERVAVRLGRVVEHRVVLCVSEGTCQRSIRAKVSARLAQGLASLAVSGWVRDAGMPWRYEWTRAGGQCLCVSASEWCGAAAAQGRPKARLRAVGRCRESSSEVKNKR